MAVACAACSPRGQGTAQAPSEEAPPQREPVKRWMIATTGDEPPSCDERLAAEGLGPDEDPLGIPFEIVHLNEMSALRLLAISYTVDGECAFSWGVDRGNDAQPNQLNVLRTQLAPGEHEIGLVAEYGPRFATPHGYDYRMKVRGAYVVNLDSATRVFITSYEKGDIQTPIEKRPSLRFELGELSSPPVMLRSRGTSR